MANPEIGEQVLEALWPMLEDIAEREKTPKLEGRYINMLVTPKK
jgi:translation initiation factor IF-3